MSIINTLMSQAAGSPKKVSLVGWVTKVSTNNNIGLVSLATIDIRQGDLIIVSHQRASLGDKTANMSLATAGYTLLSTQYSDDSYDSNQKVYYRFSDGTETDITIPIGDNTNETSSVHVVVWRNVASINLIGSNLGVNSGWPTFPVATGVTYGGVVVCTAVSAHIYGGSTYYTIDPTMTKITEAYKYGSSAAITSAIAYIEGVVGSFASSQWYNASSTSTNSNIGTTLVLLAS